ncbi:MAG: hypothetical protein DDT27_01484 [Dehalococcoidia bacterium]|nr:hypothetical protein [Chloroflexota bacterium]
MFPGLEHTHHLRIRQNGRYRIKSSRQGFADEGEVGLNAIMLLRQQFAGAAQAGLNFIQYQHNIMFFANGFCLFEITGGGDDHAGFTLDRLHQKADGVGGNGRL